MENSHDIQAQAQQQLKPLTLGSHYTWEPTAQFSLDGVEFTNAFNGVNTLVSSPEFQQKKMEVFTTLQLFDILQRKLQLAVTNGTAIEVISDNPNIISEVLPD